MIKEWELFEKARQLAETLADSPALHAFQEAEIDLLNDETAQMLLGDIAERESLLQSRGRENTREGRFLADEIRGLVARLEARPSYIRFVELQHQCDRFMSLVLDQISYAISGTRRQDVPCGAASEPPSETLQEPAFRDARELGTLLVATAEYLDFKDAERKMLADVQLRRWVEELEDTQERLRSFHYTDRTHGERLRFRVESLRRNISRHPLYVHYIQARDRFDILTGQLLDVISLHLTGEHRSDTGCSSGGSRCGCGMGLRLPSRIQRERLATTVYSEMS